MDYMPTEDSAGCSLADAATAKRDRAVLAIAPIIFDLTERGRLALELEGTAYFSDAELEKLYSIVHAVERELEK